MTFKEYLLILSIGHIIADFYMQSTEMSEKKEHKMRWVFLHSLTYWIGMLLVTLPFASWNMFNIATMAGASHCMIDLAKYLFKKFGKKSNGTCSYCKIYCKI